MARPLRIEYEGAFYHVTARGNERRKIFFSKSDYNKFKDYLKESRQKYGCLLHCYVLMTNHYHLLIETPKANLSNVMHHLNGSYTSYTNRKRGRSGHLFQGRYKAILVDRDTYLLELSRYVHLNPVRAKMAAKPEDYPHSTYRSYITKAEDDIVYHDLIMGMISKDRKEAAIRYREFVEQAIGEQLENPLENVYGGMILGGQGFIKEALSKLKEEILHREDISHRRELRTALRSEDVVVALTKHFNISRDEVFTNKNEYRDIAIYLMKKNTGLTNRQIGNLFGDISYSAVAKAYQRFSAKLTRDRSLRKEVQGVMANLSHVKG